MKRLAPLILTLLLLAGDGLFKCWYSSWCVHPESSRLYLTGGSVTGEEAEATAGR